MRLEFVLGADQQVARTVAGARDARVGVVLSLELGELKVSASAASTSAPLAPPIPAIQAPLRKVGSRCWGCNVPGGSWAVC